MKRSDISWTAALASLVLLAACGGGGGAEPAPPVAVDPLEVPASAGQSNAGLVSWLGTLPTLSTDTREAVSVDGFSPTRTEDDEPLPVGG